MAIKHNTMLNLIHNKTNANLYYVAVLMFSYRTGHNPKAGSHTLSVKVCRNSHAHFWLLSGCTMV